MNRDSATFGKYFVAVTWPQPLSAFGDICLLMFFSNARYRHDLSLLSCGEVTSHFSPRLLW